MNEAQAWEIIRECKNWNTTQTSVKLAFDGIRTPEDDMLDAKRLALTKAWKVVGEIDATSSIQGAEEGKEKK